MDNMELYNKWRTVPIEAKKPIAAGRLKGKTDINPMWRIKVLTEQFGVCGIGWYYDIVRTWIDLGADGEAIANVEINLFVRVRDDWSKPIKGMGGAMFIAKEASRMYTDDDCYKKALTDAISVSCKALGIGADVYYEKDNSKYQITETPPPVSISVVQIDKLIVECERVGWSNAKLIVNFNKMFACAIDKIEQATDEQYQKMAAYLGGKPDKVVYGH